MNFNYDTNEYSDGGGGSGWSLPQVMSQTQAAPPVLQASKNWDPEALAYYQRRGMGSGWDTPADALYQQGGKVWKPLYSNGSIYNLNSYDHRDDNNYIGQSYDMWSPSGQYQATNKFGQKDLQTILSGALGYNSQPSAPSQAASSGWTPGQITSESGNANDAPAPQPAPPPVAPTNTAPYTLGGQIDPAVTQHLQDLVTYNSQNGSGYGGAGGSLDMGNGNYIAPVVNSNTSTSGNVNDGQQNQYTGIVAHNDAPYTDGKLGYAYDTAGNPVTSFDDKPYQHDALEYGVMAALAAMSGGAAGAGIGGAAGVAAGSAEGGALGAGVGGGAIGAIPGAVAGGVGDATAAGYAGLDAASTATLGGGASGAYGGGLGLSEAALGGAGALTGVPPPVAPGAGLPEAALEGVPPPVAPGAGAPEALSGVPPPVAPGAGAPATSGLGSINIPGLGNVSLGQLGSLGSIISQLTGGSPSGSSAGGSGGSGGSEGGGLGIGSILNLLAGGYGAQQQGRAATEMKQWLQSQQAKIDNLYNPGTPEFNSLWDQMSRKDAAAGRNSQYGPRSVDLAARVAQIKADETQRFTSGTSRAYADALNQNASRYSGLAGALGANSMGGGVQNLSSLIQQLTGGTSQAAMNTGSAVGASNDATSASDYAGAYPADNGLPYGAEDPFSIFW